MERETNAWIIKILKGKGVTNIPKEDLREGTQFLIETELGEVLIITIEGWGKKYPLVSTIGINCKDIELPNISPTWMENTSINKYKTIHFQNPIGSLGYVTNIKRIIIL